MRDKLFLLILSVLIVLGFYLIYVHFRLGFFKPSVDYSLYVPSLRYHLRPEIEVQLYTLGVLAITIISPVIYFIINRLRVPQLLFKFLSLASLLVLVTAVILVAKSLMLDSFLSTSAAIQLFKENSYNFFDGLSRTEFILIFEIVTVLLLVLIRSGGKEKISSKFSFLILLIILVSVSVFIPFRRNSLSGGPYYDYCYIIGPINDILHGKTPMVDVVSQYGLLSSYFLSVPFKFGIPLTFDNFFWMYYSVTVGGYFLAYLIMRRLVGGFILPILGLFLILQQDYFLQIDSLLAYPQTGFLRFGWWIIIVGCLILFSKLKISERARFFFELLLVCIASFWVLDGGVYVLGAYISMLVFREIMKRENRRSTLVNIARKLFILSGGLIFFFALISLCTLVRSGLLPDWAFFTGDSKIFIGGFGMLPITPVGPYLFFLLFYLIFLIYVMYLLFISKRKLEKDDTAAIIVFIGFYGILQFIYFVGRSHPNNLHHVVIPLIILLLWFVKKALTFSKRNAFFLFGSLLSLLTFSAIVGTGISDMALLFKSRGSGLPELDRMKDEEGYSKSITAIKRELAGKIGKDRRVAILSKDETFFLVYSDSANVIDSNNISYFSLMSDLEKLGKQFINRRPEHVFIDHNVYIDHVGILKKKIEGDYTFKENVGVLDIWESKNL